MRRKASILTVLFIFLLHNRFIQIPTAYLGNKLLEGPIQYQIGKAPQDKTCEKGLCIVIPFVISCIPATIQ